MLTNKAERILIIHVSVLFCVLIRPNNASGIPTFTEATLENQKQEQQVLSSNYWEIDSLRKEVFSKVKTKDFFVRESPFPILYFDTSDSCKGLVMGVKATGSGCTSGRMREEQAWIGAPYKCLPDKKHQLYSVTMKMMGVNYNSVVIKPYKDKYKYYVSELPGFSDLLEHLSIGDEKYGVEYFEKLENANYSNVKYIVLRNFWMKLLIAKRRRVDTGFDMLAKSIPVEWLKGSIDNEVYPTLKKLSCQTKTNSDAEYFRLTAKLLQNLESCIVKKMPANQNTGLRARTSERGSR
jgi:hypothetical protein